MFNSISNNFGAPQIQFKDYQAPNYVVLNAKVTFDPTNPAYQACDQLEITVPDLTIDRSTIGGVFVRFVETQTYSWGDSIYDGGTVLKSWIKDKNTIVVEKQPWFDQNGPLILYFVTMYAQLNQGANTIKGTKQRLTVTTEGNYLRFSSDSFVVVFDHWVVPAELIAGEPYLIPVALAGLRAHGALVILAEAFQLLSAGGHVCSGSRIDPCLPQGLFVLLLL